MVKIDIDKDKCIGCGACVNGCPVSLYVMSEGKCEISGDLSACVLCRACEVSCPTGAITVSE